MKNILQITAIVCMTLITSAAISQSENNLRISKSNRLPQGNPIPLAKGFYGSENRNKSLHRIGSPLLNGQFNYAYWDELICNTYAIPYSVEYIGWYAQLINMHYTEADTGNGSNKNYPLIQSMTVAFDSMWDAYSNRQYGPKEITINTLDTIFTFVAYKNTSGLNDTVIFQVVNTLNGYPGNSVLKQEMVILNKGLVLPGNTLDSLYIIAALPNLTLFSNPFAVNIQYYGSKLDTFEVAYGFPYFTCTYNYAYLSFVGIPLPGAYDYANSFSTGWELYNSNLPIELPTNLGGYIYYGACVSDTEFIYWQDVAIFPSFTYDTNAVVGINNLSSGGLDVSQNYPNPFNKETQISYNLINTSDVSFEVYDMTGRIIVNNTYYNASPGQHIINLNANTLSPGIYFYTFKVEGSEVTKKMVITE